MGRADSAIVHADGRRRTAREREHELRLREEREESDKLERSIAMRRWIYQQDLYAKVRVGVGQILRRTTARS